MNCAWRITRSDSPARRGVTLLELLIVMTIMVMVTAAAIPVMLPAMANRRMRESSRLVSAYFSAARSQAIASGRPVGVMIERFEGKPYAMSLSTVEVPAPYCGDTVSSKMIVGPNGQITSLVSDTGGWNGMLRCGDLVRLNYRGPLYILSTDATNASSKLGTAIKQGPNWYLFSTSGLPINLPATYTNGVPFQIFRQPVRSSTAPLQLPEGTVVDLGASGVGLADASAFNTTGDPNMPNVTFNPIVTFSPNGAVDYVSFWNGTYAQFVRPTSTIFLLVGQRDLMPDVSPSSKDENVYDPNIGSPMLNRYLQNFWISIGYQTGLVAVNENAGSNNGQVNLARGGPNQAFTQPTGGL